MTMESTTKREAYNKMLNKIAYISTQIDDGKKKSERFRILLQGKIESYQKMNEKAFEKLRADRLARQKSLDKFIEDKTQWLLKKSIQYQIIIQSIR